MLLNGLPLEVQEKVHAIFREQGNWNNNRTEAHHSKKVHHLPFVWDDFQRNLGPFIADIEQVLEDHRKSAAENNAGTKRNADFETPSDRFKRLKTEGKCGLCSAKWFCGHLNVCPKKAKKKAKRSSHNVSSDTISKNDNAQNKSVPMVRISNDKSSSQVCQSFDATVTSSVFERESSHVNTVDSISSTSQDAKNSEVKWVDLSAYYPYNENMSFSDYELEIELDNILNKQEGYSSP